MRYFLDSNIIVYALKDKYPTIKEHILHIPAESIAIPSVVVAEIEYGAKKSHNYEKTIALYSSFFDFFQIVDFTRKSASLYGDIRKKLESSGSIIGANDMMIAAIVMAEGGVLITHNTKEFKRVENLKIEDWTRR